MRAFARWEKKEGEEDTKRGSGSKKDRKLNNLKKKTTKRQRKREWKGTRLIKKRGNKFKKKES